MKTLPSMIAMLSVILFTGCATTSHRTAWEYRIITALYGTDIPVARPYCICDDDSVIGTPFYVMAHVDGRQFMDPALPGLAPQERRAIWDEFNSMVAALRSDDSIVVVVAEIVPPAPAEIAEVERTLGYALGASITEFYTACGGVKLIWTPEALQDRFDIWD